MRARLAISASKEIVRIREIELRNKPAIFLAASPKGTVPVLEISNGQVIEESWDIMMWFLKKSDPNEWLRIWRDKEDFCTTFLADLDYLFKKNLDKYKYSNTLSANIREESRQICHNFLSNIDRELLSTSGFLSGNSFGLLDAATLPFVRQFRGVDSVWFDQQSWTTLHVWLDNFIGSSDFKVIMQKYPVWKPGDMEQLFLR